MKGPGTVQRRDQSSGGRFEDRPKQGESSGGEVTGKAVVADVRPVMMMIVVAGREALREAVAAGEPAERATVD